MNKDIKKRLASNEWDFKIASAVVHHRKKTRLKVISAGIAASVIIAGSFLLFPVIQKSSGDGSEFVSEQIAGVYYKAYESTSGSDPVDEALDSIIMY